MKIDIHVHTKRCKSGDAPTREISSDRFCEIASQTDVDIFAITNHNTFDLQQYNAIEGKLEKDIQVWPGIELDVQENEKRGHLLVIVSPRNADDFKKIVDDVTAGANPDNFSISIDDILTRFDEFGPLYVAHYKQKKPDMSEVALERLSARTRNPSRIIKEVSNAISAGIYISHGYPSIYGSDVQDWNDYINIAGTLPDLRFPVESFEHFCLLLQKDSNTINTLLDQKKAEDISVSPFSGECELSFKVFNDINVIFGPKGTGKTCILNAIAQHYSQNGLDSRVYSSNERKLEDIYSTKDKNLNFNLVTLGIDYCGDEIDDIRSAKEFDITLISKYTSHFKSQNSNKNAQKILIRNIGRIPVDDSQNAFIRCNESLCTVEKFVEFLEEDQVISVEMSKDEGENLKNSLSNLLIRLREVKVRRYLEWKSAYMLNSAISCFGSQIARKTGNAEKPMSTGFLSYAKNRINIERKACKILKNIGMTIPSEKKLVGNLGPDKGDLFFCAEYKFHDGFVWDSDFLSNKGIGKLSQKNFSAGVRDILAHAYDDKLFSYISNINDIEDISKIATVYELIIFKKYFSIEGVCPYKPSSGEASMLMLQRELGIDKDVYILDEPEKSLGNEYISDVIVPILKEKARSGRRVFISTHDANIAVRTLPYSSMYRRHGPNGYLTYIGNPFANHLVNIQDSDDKLDWKDISMRTLEGGEKAFGERRMIYGKN